MHRIRNALAMAALVALAACQTTSSGERGTASVSPCDDAANPDAVLGDGKCVGIKTFGSAAPGGNLVVVLHGDVSSGGAAGYHYVTARDATGLAPDTIGVGMLRPGYVDDEGRRSQGSHNNRRDHYTATNIDIMAGAIRALKDRHQSAKVFVVGHSGGAATTGVILGRHPDLIDGAVLVGCPCDVPFWRRSRNRSAWNRSLSPHRYIDQLREDVKIIAVNGSDDRNTTTALALRFIEPAGERGIDAVSVELPGAGHNWRRNVREGALTALRAVMTATLAPAES